jgi:hypothetical protein
MMLLWLSILTLASSSAQGLGGGDVSRLEPSSRLGGGGGGGGGGGDGGSGGDGSGQLEPSSGHVPHVTGHIEMNKPADIPFSVNISSEQ